jgi:hypothetical protein
MKKLLAKDATGVRRHARLEGGGQEETAFRFSKKQRKHRVREAKPGWRSETSLIHFSPNLSSSIQAALW